ncbi:MAG: nitroreductase family protein [Opitutaceae bacterium]|nr:nitroreductase family protein [Opitutaceae bacterium]
MSQLTELLHARYGAAAPKFKNGANQAITTLLQHRSVRAYLPDPIDDETLGLIIAAAQSASTSSNIQAWSVVAVRDPERKARLAALAANQKQILEAPLFLVWVADLSRLRRIANQIGDPAEGLERLDSFLVGVTDTTIAAQSAVAAAESLGYGVVYIGALRSHPDKVAAELNLPPGAFPLYGLVVGKPDPARPASVKPRLPQKVVLHQEQYSAAAETEALAEYEKIIQEFQASQKLPIQEWKKQAVGRVKVTEASNGRTPILEALGKLGFITTH